MTGAFAKGRRPSTHRCSACIVPARSEPILAARESRIRWGFSTDEWGRGAAIREAARDVKKGTGNCLPFVKTGARGPRNSCA
jgi:hypothetical protein